MSALSEQVVETVDNVDAMLRGQGNTRDPFPTKNSVLGDLGKLRRRRKELERLEDIDRAVGEFFRAKIGYSRRPKDRERLDKAYDRLVAVYFNGSPTK